MRTILVCLEVLKAFWFVGCTRVLLDAMLRLRFLRVPPEWQVVPARRIGYDCIDNGDWSSGTSMGAGGERRYSYK